MSSKLNSFWSAFFGVAAVAGLSAQTPAPDEILQRGRDSFRSGHYEDAVKDLTAAADGQRFPLEAPNDAAKISVNVVSEGAVGEERVAPRAAAVVRALSPLRGL